MPISCAECGQTLEQSDSADWFEYTACAFSGCYVEICDSCFYAHVMFHYLGTWHHLRETESYGKGVKRRVRLVKEWMSRDHGPTQETRITGTRERTRECGSHENSSGPESKDRSETSFTTQVQQTKERTEA
jgi:hypothetical protein